MTLLNGGAIAAALNAAKDTTVITIHEHSAVHSMGLVYGAFIVIAAVALSIFVAGMLDRIQRKRNQKAKV